MKHLKKIMISALLLVFLISSCKKNDIKTTPPLNDNSIPSASVSGLNVTKKDQTQVEFTMQIAVFKDSRNMEYQFDKSRFTIDTISVNGFDCAFSNISTVLAGGGASKAYSSLMLLDQSGSISSTDPMDYRLSAAKTFVSNLGLSNNAWVWSFAGSAYTKYGDAFSTDTTALLQQIENLRNKESGSTPLYMSQYNAIQACADKANKENKALLTFTDGDDTQGGYTSDQVAAKAVASNVKLFNIGLGSSTSLKLLKQAIDGKGAFMYASDARQLISMFGNLGKLLDGSARFYNITWKATLSGTGTFSSGTFLTKLRIHTPYNYTIVIPLEVRY